MPAESFKSKWVSATIKTETYRTEILSGTHNLLADEPLEAGGTDLGPAPGDFVRMSLASCTAITLRMYADKKGWDVSEIKVKVSTEEAEGKTIFHSSIGLTGELNEDQRKRLLQIAKLCPVHKLLSNPIEVFSVMN